MGHLDLIVRIYLVFAVTCKVSGFSPSRNFLEPRTIREKFDVGKGLSAEDIDFRPLKTATESDEDQQQSTRHRLQPNEIVLPNHQSQTRPETMKYYRYPLSIVAPTPGTDSSYEPFASAEDEALQQALSENFNNFVDYEGEKQDIPGGMDYETEWKFLNNLEKVAGKNEFLWKLLNDNVQLTPGQKRSAFHAYKRQKARTQFVPSVSVGAMTHLGHFFDHLKNNIDVLERKALTEDQLRLLEGDHPVKTLRHELSPDSLSSRPTGTAAFLHAIRTYRPSQRVRALVATNPEGYHGSNFLDPNYMWIGLGRK